MADAFALLQQIFALLVLVFGLSFLALIDAIRPKKGRPLVRKKVEIPKGHLIEVRN